MEGEKGNVVKRKNPMSFFSRSLPLLSFLYVVSLFDLDLSIYIHSSARKCLENNAKEVFSHNMIDIVKCLMCHQKLSEKKLVANKDLLNWMRTNKAEERNAPTHVWSSLDLGQPPSPALADRTDTDKVSIVSPARSLQNTTTGERVSFTLKKQVSDDEKDEVVYSSISNHL